MWMVLSWSRSIHISDTSISLFVSTIFQLQDQKVRLPDSKNRTPDCIVTETSPTDPQTTMLRNVYVYLREILERKRAKEEKDRVEAEWRLMAIILDRFMMAVFALFAVGMILVFLWFIPSVEEKALT